MRIWDVAGMEVEAHHPQILSSSDAARVIALELPAGEKLQEHMVHERAWLLVVAGEIDITSKAGETSAGGPGMLAEFDPKEPHEVSARSRARLLLFLAPWPGDGHPGAMGLEEKAEARERARDHAAGEG